MCFSATASFVAGAALSATGAVTISEAQKKSKIPFASIPLLFGIQQIIEGGVWLSFQNGLPFLNKIATYFYLAFAYLLWPVFVPVSVGLLETDPHRKKILYAFQFLGATVSAYLLYFMVSRSIVSHVVNESIAYTMPHQYGVFIVGMYMLAICGSCLFSSHRIINAFGVLTALSFTVAYYFYTVSFVSVWCFFAAVLSIVVYLYLKRN